MAAVYDSSIFNVDPYYDDYSELKNFHRMLFVPGRAVQARELTQLQTIQQDQINRLGLFLLKDGSKVYGGNIFQQPAVYFKVQGLTNTTDIADFDGLYVSTLNGNRATAKVLDYVTGDSSLTNDPYNVLLIQYISGGTAFAAGDTLAATSADGSTLYQTSVVASSVTGGPTGQALVVSIDEGVRFVNGYFVKHDQQKITPYNVTTTRNFTTPTSRIGFDISSDIITEDEDSSLNDPAFGSFNFGAPGSHRYKVSLDINHYELDPSDIAATGNFANENFIEFLRVAGGTAIKKEAYPELATLEDTLARRTYDESGNYSISPFLISFSETGASSNQLNVKINPGKAYVFGYEFETTFPNNIKIDRARPPIGYDVNLGDESIATLVAPITLSTSPGLWISAAFAAGATSANVFPSSYNLESHPRVLLCSGLTNNGTTAGSSPIGYARLRQISRISDSLYRLHLTEIELNSGKNLANTTKIYDPSLSSGNMQFMFYIPGPTGNTNIQDQARNKLIFPVPQGNTVRTFNSIEFTAQKAKYFSTFSSGFLTINKQDFSDGAAVGNLASEPETRFPGDASYNIPDSKCIAFDLRGRCLTGTATPTGTNNSKLDVQFNNTTITTAVVCAAIESNDSSPSTSPAIIRTKANTTATITVNAGGGFETDTRNRQFLFMNGYTDVNSIISISGQTGSAVTRDMTDWFELDSNQNDNLYDWSMMVLKKEREASGANSVTGSLSVQFRYFAHSGKGPFTVNSYTGVNGVDYKDIPEYISPVSGQVVNLRDVLDFRPIRLGAASATARSNQDNYLFGNAFTPLYGYSTDIDYEYYLPRTDKLVITKDREFKIIKGIYNGSEAPAPADRDDAMTLYRIKLNPYTFNEKDVTISQINNRRYTMKDIGQLEKRLESVEYYTTLSLLELQAQNLVVLDSQGNDRFKNGILVDSFRGHQIGDVTNPYYQCSMDFVAGELRPTFTSRMLDFELSGSVGTGLTLTNDRTVLLDYTIDPVIQQPLASKSISVNPFNVVNWTGIMTLTPSSDNWVDVEQRPDVIVNLDGENNAWSDFGTGATGVENGFGTQWNDWEDNWFGRSTQGPINDRNYKTYRTDAERRQNKNTNASRSGFPGSLQRGIDQVNNTNRITKIVGDRIVDVSVVPFMREQSLTASCVGLKPTTRVYAFFDGTDVSSSVYYNGSQGSPLVTDSSGNITLRYDIPSGTYRTGERLFRVCDNSANSGQVTTIAECVFPSTGLLQTKENVQISTRAIRTRRPDPSSDSSTNPLTRNRRPPIILPPGSIYTDNRNLWVDPLAQSFLVDAQYYPYGIFVDSIDLFFAAKDSALPITVEIRPTVNGYPSANTVLATKTLQYTDVNVSDDATTITRFKFDSPTYLPTGEYSIVIISNSDNYECYIAEIGLNRLDTNEKITQQPYQGSLFKSQNASTWTAEQNQDLTFRINRCVFDTSERTIVLQNNATTDYGTETVKANTYFIDDASIVPGNSNLEHELKFVDGDAPYDSYFRVLPNITQTLVNEQDIKPFNDATIDLRLTLNAGNGNVLSPVVDFDKLSVLCVQNNINYNTELTGPNDNGELNPDPSGVTASNVTKCRYITKTVNLEEGFEGGDIKVFLTASKPEGTEIHVFAKYLSSEDETPMSLKSYIQLPIVNDVTSVDSTDYRELQFAPSAGSIPAGVSFASFVVKIVLYASDSSVIPVVKNMRAIVMPEDS